jgi:hypothetical protein
MAINIRLSFPYTFLDRVSAEFALIPESKLKIFIYSIIPLFGLAFLAFVLWRQLPLTATIWLLVLVFFLFNPVLTILGVGINHLLNKSTREPFTYLFDDNGIHVSAVTHEFTHRWPAILRVKSTRRRLLFFVGPGAAHCIPMSVVKQAGVLDALLELVREKGVKVVAP